MHCCSPWCNNDDYDCYGNDAGDVVVMTDKMAVRYHAVVQTVMITMINVHNDNVWCHDHAHAHSLLYSRHHNNLMLAWLECQRD